MTSSNATVVVMGARGRLGLEVVRAFAAAGWQVRATLRPGGLPPAQAPAGVQWVALDVTDHAATRRVAEGARVVVHAMNPGRYTAAAWRAEAPALLLAALEATRHAGALLLFPGNVYNYGPELPRRLDARTPQRATTGKGQVRVALEQQLAQAVTAQGLHAVVIRAGDFFGGGRGTWVDQVIAKRLAQGRVTWPGPLEVAHAWAYLPDLAQAFVRVAQATPRCLPGTLEDLPFAGHTVTGQDWVQALQVAAAPQGQPLRVGTLPWGLMRLAAPLSAMVASLVEMRYLWQRPHALDGLALAQRVGPLPHTPFVQAVEAAVHAAQLLSAERPRGGAPAHPVEA